ncbi:proline-rich extensin-like family protein [Actinidia rufa]|uniref:Proline-rich extensin-like family protein n=1 Tax=Actinidia rufa TaxID=165716 RepID=A0A7J0DQA0_9ERIC|nr:proline-rich extensin-like family protein [Actinidia rufa]
MVVVEICNSRVAEVKAMVVEEICNSKVTKVMMVVETCSSMVVDEICNSKVAKVKAMVVEEICNSKVAKVKAILVCGGKGEMAGTCSRMVVEIFNSRGWRWRWWRSNTEVDAMMMVGMLTCNSTVEVEMANKVVETCSNMLEKLILQAVVEMYNNMEVVGMEKVGEGTCKRKWVWVKVGGEVICRSKMVTWAFHIPYMMEFLVQKKNV